VGGALDGPLSCLPQETTGLHRHSRRSKWLLRRAASLGSSSSVFRVSASRAAHSQDKGPLSAVGPARAGRPAALGRPGQARSPPGTRPVMMGDVANYSNFCFPHLLESGRTYYACGSDGDRSVIALRLKVDPAAATHDHTRQPLEPLPGRPTGDVRVRAAIPFEVPSNRFSPESSRSARVSRSSLTDGGTSHRMP
jgi:hypothetical protein